MVVGASLPCQSGVSFGTSTSRPSTLTLIFSIAGGAGLVSVVDAADICLFQLPIFRRAFFKYAGKVIVPIQVFSFVSYQIFQNNFLLHVRPTTSASRSSPHFWIATRRFTRP